LILFKSTWQFAPVKAALEISFQGGVTFNFMGFGTANSIVADVPRDEVKPFLHHFTADETGSVSSPAWQEPPWTLDLHGTTPAITAMVTCIDAGRIFLPPPFRPPQTPTSPPIEPGGSNIAQTAAELHAPFIPGTTVQPETPTSPIEIQLQSEGGVFVVPVSINDAITLNFIIDSGASDVCLPADVVMTLIRTGTVRQEDFTGNKTYQLADGTTVPSATFRIRVLNVGGRRLENVTASIGKVEGSLLLGQSFLDRFESWSIDNRRHVLRLN
jgi:clan AA aspartic protease (TIGR02281 family)